MAQKLIDVLAATVEPALFGRTTKEIGDVLYVVLDAERRISVRLTTAGYAGNYEVLLLILTSKTAGEINRLGLSFKSLLGTGKMVTEDYRGGYTWRGVSENDIGKLRKAVSDYIEMWD